MMKQAARDLHTLSAIYVLLLIWILYLLVLDLLCILQQASYWRERSSATQATCFEGVAHFLSLEGGLQL